MARVSMGDDDISLSVMPEAHRFINKIFEDEMMRKWLWPMDEAYVDDALDATMMESAYAFQIAVEGSGGKGDKATVLFVPQRRMGDYVLGYVHSELSESWYYQVHEVEKKNPWPVNGSYRFAINLKDARIVNVVQVLADGNVVMVQFEGLNGFVRGDSVICGPPQAGEFPKEVRLVVGIEAMLGI